MAERPIVLYGDPVLREVSEPVDEINQEVKDLVSDLVDTIKKAKGLGLAAVQIWIIWQNSKTVSHSWLTKPLAAMPGSRAGSRFQPYSRATGRPEFSICSVKLAPGIPQ